VSLPHLYDSEQPSNRSEKKLFNSEKKIEYLGDNMPQKAKGDGGSAAQKRRAAPLTDTARPRKNTYTPVVSDTTAEKGTADKSKATTN
jgi:hypothetical protein